MAVRRRLQGGRAAKRARADLGSGAAGQGWDLDDTEVPVPEVTFPSHLVAHMLKPVARDRVVRGEGFVAASWRCSRLSGGRLAVSAVRLHVLQVTAPGVRSEIFFGRMPEAGRAIVMPELFRDRVALLPEAQVMAGGDLEQVLAELEPMLGEIAGPGLSLVVTPEEVALLSLEEADTEMMQTRVDLAHRVVAALVPTDD